MRVAFGANGPLCLHPGAWNTWNLGTDAGPGVDTRERETLADW